MVTGAGGFVGANLVRRLLADGNRVVALVRPGSRLWRLEDVRDAVEVVEVDLRDGEAAAGALRQAAPSWVFHLATHGAYSSQRDTPRILATNVLGTATLTEAALDAGVEAFVNAGSSSEYGYKDHAPGETEFVDPNSAYAVGKAAATMYCRHRSLEADAHIVTLRLYSVYGPWEEPARLIPTLACKGLEGELPELVDPAIARDFVYVDDVVGAFVLAAEAEPPRGAIYNVGSGGQHTLAEVVDTLRSLLPIEAEPEWGSMPNRTWDTGTWVADASLIERELGWRAETDFTTGLRATIEWLDDSAERRAFYAER
jgi:dolichol-phosphate mannosyltransferase